MHILRRAERVNKPSSGRGRGHVTRLSLRQRFFVRPLSSWIVRKKQPCGPSAPEKGEHSLCCACQRKRIPLCRIVPRQVFGESYFSAPVLVLLRLCFPALSLDLRCKYARACDDVVRSVDALHKPKTCSSTSVQADGGKVSPVHDKFSYLGQKFSTVDFCHHIQSSPHMARHQVTSITWVKALRSNMSHEFVQFVVEDPESGQKCRLISDRHENGDWVFTTKADQTVDKLSWMKVSPYKERHNAPLPLISLTFDHPGSRPSLVDMVTLLAEITSRNPYYSPVREMCWWYAEKVIESARFRWPQARLKEWTWAKYRYTFVIFNDWIRRKRLASHADDFETLCMHDMMY